MHAKWATWLRRAAPPLAGRGRRGSCVAEVAVASAPPPLPMGEVAVASAPPLLVTAPSRRSPPPPRSGFARGKLAKCWPLSEIFLVRDPRFNIIYPQILIPEQQSLSSPAVANT